MAVPKKVFATGSHYLQGAHPAASRIGFGSIVAVSTASEGANSYKMVEAETMVLGIAGNREYLPKGKYDGFWEAYEDVPVVYDMGYALCIPNGAAINIDVGDALEVAVLGDGTPGNHGLLEEAGSAAGTVFTVATVAKALESVTMGSKSYKIPASAVTAGDSTITMTAGEIATMGITVGDYICLEDTAASLGAQLNKVASLTSTVIGLEIPAAFALGTDHDLVTRCYPVLVRMVK
jgi:hypothetical protein